MAAIAKWTAYATADVAVAAASLNALASGTAAANMLLGSAIDNTAASFGYLYGDLEINLSSAVTAGTGSPALLAYIIPALDGTNYASTGTGTIAGPTAIQYLAGIVNPVASTAVKVMHIRGIVLPPCNFKVMINNQLGVTFPATTTSTCLLYRYNEQSV